MSHTSLTLRCYTWIDIHRRTCRKQRATTKRVRENGKENSNKKQESERGESEWRKREDDNMPRYETGGPQGGVQRN